MQEKSPHPELTEWIRTLGQIRKEHPESIYGAYRELLLTNRQYAFARIEGDKAVVVAVNNDENQESQIWVPVPVGGKTYTDVISGEACPEDGGRLKLFLPPNGVKILCIE